MISLRWYEFTRTTIQLMIQAMFLSFADYSYHLPVFVLFAKIVFAVVVFVIIIIISKNRFSIRMSLIICKYGVTNVVQRQNKKRKKNAPFVRISDWCSSFWHCLFQLNSSANSTVFFFSFRFEGLIQFEWISRRRHHFNFSCDFFLSRKNRFFCFYIAYVVLQYNSNNNTSIYKTHRFGAHLSLTDLMGSLLSKI